MSNYLRKVFLKLLKRRNLVVNKWYALKAKVHCCIADGVFVIGDEFTFNVPVRCDGKGKVVLGERVSIGYGKAPRTGNGEALVQARNKEAVVSIGARTATSNNISIVATQSITIGCDCIIGDNVFIVDSDFHNVEPELRRQPIRFSNPVIIGDNVWLGSRAMVLKGVNIGNNSVVAAGAVVVKSVPENVLVAGVPAKVVKQLSSLAEAAYG